MGVRKFVTAMLATASIAAGGVAQADDTVTLGFTAALSGDFAAFGENMRRGAELAIEQLNADGTGPTFELFPVDDRGEAREGVLIAQRFCSDEDVDVVLGYSFSSIALAAVPVYDQCGLPVLASAVTSPDLSGASPYFRRNILTDAVQGAMMGTFAVETLGDKRIYVIHQQDDYGIGVANAFTEAAEAAGAEILGTENYLLGAKDFKTQISRIRSADPDALFIGGFYSEAAKIASQAQSLGVDVQLLGTDGSLNPELVSLGGEAVEGMIVYGMFDPSVATEDTAAFIEGYEAAHGMAPNAFSALGYDAVMTVAEAVRIATEAGDLTRESLNTAFGEIDGFPGVTGPTTFDAQGDRAGSLYFLQVRDGAFALAE
ncbi:ABC transporter substrate-binding protein [Marivibrio halodurans]|uniref:ABC transporter substrate-binding protein n=1 Tax=Marivibrio halodurans TaxID=2039722 RepID=A0A8J7S092_9PROT|nr:ABC transporter substrate-binding protein [Marivibrio halodurans]